jgi:hypothetical protein
MIVDDFGLGGGVGESSPQHRVFIRRSQSVMTKKATSEYSAQTLSPRLSTDPILVETTRALHQDSLGGQEGESAHKLSWTAIRMRSPLLMPFAMGSPIRSTWLSDIISGLARETILNRTLTVSGPKEKKALRIAMLVVACLTTVKATTATRIRSKVDGVAEVRVISAWMDPKAMEITTIERQMATVRTDTTGISSRCIYIYDAIPFFQVDSHMSHPNVQLRFIR